VNLIKEVENSDTFFIINSIDLRGAAADSGNSGRGNTAAPVTATSDVNMNLNLETFFYQ
jgi:hypothetical protein